MTDVHYVQHTHWDREWYFTTMDSLALSDQIFSEILDELERHPENNFCLDGQTSIVDDYVAIHPEAKARIRALVAHGQLFIGPWYTQTDALIPDAEAMLRNLVIGIKDCKDSYGKPMMIGYLPDTFGFCAQLPAILRQAGIGSVIFWRGFNLEKQIGSIYFVWRGLGDESVIAADLPFGYSTAMLPAAIKDELDEFVARRYDPAVRFDLDHGARDAVLMPSGTDQLTIIHQVEETLRDINARSDFHTIESSYPAFMETLRQRKNELPIYQGDFRIPTYARVHRSIGMVRPDLKRDIAALEQKILRRIEPLTVIGHQVGVHIGNGLLLHLWKLLLECEPHDTMGGCISDNVAQDVVHRLKQANEIADGIENLIERKIAEALDLSEDQILVFNLDPYAFSGRKSLLVVAADAHFAIAGIDELVITDEIRHSKRRNVRVVTPEGEKEIDEPAYSEYYLEGSVDLEPLGYKVFEKRRTKTALPSAEISCDNDRLAISQGRLTLSFDKGTVNLTIGELTIPEVIQLIDEPNAGDTYDFSPLEGAEQVVLPLANAEIAIAGKQRSLIIKGSAMRPKGLADYGSEHGREGLLRYKLRLLLNDQQQIVATLCIENEIDSHRVQIRLAPAVDSKRAIAQVQLGYVETEDLPVESDWDKRYTEKPVNIYCFDKSVSVSDATRHLTFWGLGQKNYEYHDGYLDIPILTTTGQLGRANLVWRPGRASGDTTTRGHVMMETPSAQCHGVQEFKFAFEVADGPFDEASNNMLTQLWHSQSASYQRQSTNLFIHRLDNKIWPMEDKLELPGSCSLLDLGPSASVCAMYPGYSDPEKTIVRLQNLTSKPIDVPDALMSGRVVDANETERPDQSTIGPYDWMTFKIDLRRLCRERVNAGSRQTR